MPRVWKTVLPRIRKSLRDYGLVTSLRRSVLLPIHLIREYRAARRLRVDDHKSDFDQIHGVETDGDYQGWTYLSDLKIDSPNWIDANDYLGIEPSRFHAVLSNLAIAFDEYTFVDFGSGKGRALLLASEFPFKEIIGLEFSPELHCIAEANLQRYSSPSQRCKNIRCINIDFVDFRLPQGPLLLFFFDPCRRPVLERLLLHFKDSLLADPRPIYLAYVAPRQETETLLQSSTFLRPVLRNHDSQFIVYQNIPQ